MAKIITQQEAEGLGKRPFGKKHFVFALIESLKPGEQLHVTRQDFNWRKKTPNIFVLRIMKTTSKKFSVSNTRDRSGWIVERTK